MMFEEIDLQVEIRRYSLIIQKVGGYFETKIQEVGASDDVHPESNQ